jgi:hypothetical protein
MINEELLEKTVEEVMNLIENNYNHVSPDEYVEAMKVVLAELVIHLTAAQDFGCRNAARLMHDVTKQICEDEEDDATRATESAERD